MANLEKHRRNLIEQWLDADEGAPPQQSGGTHAAGLQPKSAPRRRRPMVQAAAASKTEPALIREPAHTPRLEEKHSQASSPEHLRRLERLSKLRAPYAPNPATGFRT